MEDDSLKRVATCIRHKCPIYEPMDGTQAECINCFWERFCSDESDQSEEVSTY